MTSCMYVTSARELRQTTSSWKRPRIKVAFLSPRIPTSEPYWPVAVRASPLSSCFANESASRRGRGGVLMANLHDVEEDLLAGSLVVISDGGVRIRGLPLPPGHG